MIKRLAVACAVVMATSIVACGGTSSTDLCKQEVSKECDLYFQCLTEAEKEANKAQIGLNSDDCKTKFEANCTDVQTSCGAGQTYHDDKAQSCADQISKFSCADITGTTITAPAVCSQVCTTD